MAKKTRSFISIILVMVMALSLCGISALADSSASVSIDQGETADVTYPDTLQLTAQHSGFHSAEGDWAHDYGDIAYSWSSGDTDVATVDSSGLVTGATPGAADVTVTATQMVRTFEWHGCGWGWSDWSTYATATDTIAVTVLEPVDVVTITVTDGTDPIEDAHVMLLGPTSPMPEGDTDANGQISFAESVVGYYDHSNTTIYDVVVTKDGYVDGSGDVSVTDDWFVEGQWAFGDADTYGYGDATVVLSPVQIETVTIGVEKIWGANTSGREQSITVRLYADGDEVDVITITSEDGWHGYFPSSSEVILYKYDGETLIDYTVAEDPLGANWSSNISEAEEDGNLTYYFDITNTYSPPYNPPVIATYYNLTVNWVDGGGSPLAAPVTVIRLAYSAYDAADCEGGSGRTFEGYTYSALADGSDAESGTMNGNRTVTFVYTVSEDVPEETPPPTPEPTEEIPDEEVPVDESPKTGDSIPLALLWLAFCASVCGLVVLTVTAPGKKRGGIR